MMLFRIIYPFFATLLYIVALPLIILLGFKNKYKNSLPARFFMRGNPPFEPGGVHFHACSLGEVNALEPLIEHYRDQNPKITVITNTGYEAALKYKLPLRYLPYEIFLPFWITPQKVLVVLEAELWYMLFLVMKQRGAKTVLLNARMSDRSFPKYKKMSWFYKRLFKNIDIVFAQSEQDRRRLLELGAGTVEVCGNIKLVSQVRCAYRFKKQGALMVTAASTHDGEERLIADAFLTLEQGRLVVAPRHPERFESVHKLLFDIAAKNGKSYHRFSQREDFDSDIVLMDRMGLLVEVYAISDIVVMGGAFRDDVGGHNPLEPAAFGCRIITGKHFFNLKSIYGEMSHIIVAEKENLQEALSDALVAAPATVKSDVDIDGLLDRLDAVITPA